MVKIQKTKRGQYFITLNKAEVEDLSWKKGDRINLGVVEKGILLTNMTSKKKGGKKK